MLLSIEATFEFISDMFSEIPSEFDSMFIKLLEISLVFVSIYGAFSVI